MKTANELFSDSAAATIWDGYCDRVLKASRALKKDDQHDLLLEIKDHLYSSFERQKGDDEAARLTAAIMQIGDPDEFIRPLIVDRLFDDAARTLNPRSVMSGFLLHISRGLKACIISFLFGIGYLLSIAFFLVAVAKPIDPDRVGLFAHVNGGYSLGIFEGIPATSTELLGYWIIPITMVVSVFLYVFLTKSLRALRTKKNGPVLGA
jgi:hypothetical protein